MRAPEAPSEFFTAWRPRLRQAAAAGPVVDLACGRGRHALAAASDGARVLAIDRDAARLAELRARARAARLPLLGLCADLESGRGIPVRPGSCGAILVFRFLFRPLAGAIVAALRPGGLLLYETFTTAQAARGRGPRNPDFLLRPGELPALFPDLEPLESWEGLSRGDPPEALARLAAVRRGDVGRRDGCSGSSTGQALAHESR